MSAQMYTTSGMYPFNPMKTYQFKGWYMSENLFDTLLLAQHAQIEHLKSYFESKLERSQNPKKIPKYKKKIKYYEDKILQMKMDFPEEFLRIC